MRRITYAVTLLAVMAGLVMQNSASAESNGPEAEPLELVRMLQVGGMPDSIVVDTWSGRNDVIFYDLASSKVKYLDGDSLLPTGDEILLPHRGFDSWMSYDRAFGHTYVLQVQREYDWDNLMVSVLNRRKLVSSFSVNEPFNANTPVDFPYKITGFASKPAFLEVNVPGRLVVDNVHGGNVDIVDLDLVGLKPEHIQRYSYRKALTTTLIRTFLGSSLALEPRRETTAIDDLAYSDLLYLMDGNTSDKQIRSFRITHGPGELNIKEDMTVDFSGIWPFSDGVQGLFVNGPADQLLVGSGIQSFDNGYAASVRTTGNKPETLEFRYSDPGFLLADWYDPNRIFLTAFDDFWNDPKAALYLRLLYGQETFSLVLESQFTKLPYVRDMAFDPHHRRLYITAEDKIYVVQVNVGAAAAPLLPPRPAMATTVLRSPWYGGQLSAPENRAVINFLPGSVNVETEVTYGEIATAPASGHLVVRAFQLNASETASGKAVTSFAKPYQVTLKYTNYELGPVDEATCALYWWNGSRWVREQAAQFDRKNNEVTVSLDHMSIFAILGDADEQLFLPMIDR